MRVPAVHSVAWLEVGTDRPGRTFARLEDSAGHHFGVFSVPAP